MGLGYHKNINHQSDGVAAAVVAPLVIGLQPAAMVDHVARVDRSLLSRIPGEPGGSFPVDAKELKFILDEVVNSRKFDSPNGTASLKTVAGGSIANTIRGLAAGFGISCGIIGAYGDDDEGSLFVDNMNSYNIDSSKLRLKKGPTSQCVCLVDEVGNRTMRPCLLGTVKVQANDLTAADFKGSKWLMMRYAILNMEVIQTAIKLAKQEGLLVSLDLASFEMVRKFRLPLLELLESGTIDLCFANEDEAAELLRDEDNTDPESALNFLAKHCRWAVVTLGSRGCIAKSGDEVACVPSIHTNAIDATGAGDLFASGFLYGLLKGLTLEECCMIGSCSGGCVVRSLGGEVPPESWWWMYQQMQSKGYHLPKPLKPCHKDDGSFHLVHVSE